MRSEMWFQGRCDSCGFESEKVRADCAGLIVDELSRDPSLDSPHERMVSLLGDSESETVRRHRYTFLSAVLAGRYVRVDQLVCCKCGHFYQQHFLGLRLGAWFWWIWALLAIPFGIVIFQNVPGTMASAGRVFFTLFFGFIFAGATIAVADGVAFAYFRCRYPTRARRFGGPKRCPTCGSKNSAYVVLFRGALPCPGCGKRTMKINSEKREARTGS